MVCNNSSPKGEFGFKLCNALSALLHGSFNVYISILYVWFKWFTGLWPGNTQRGDSLLSLNNQIEWFRRWYEIIYDGVVTERGGQEAS
jgi:hypothetical protein